MVFSSLTFLFLFITVTCLLYFLNSDRTYRNAVLLAASMVFYSWGEPRHILLMLAVAAVAYAGGLLIDRYHEAEPSKAKAVFAVTVVLILANLFIFKYLNFTGDTILALTGTDLGFPRIALPIGISFYTFQILSYVIDLYKGEVKVQKNFAYLLLYLAFFPQLIAGPIVRYITVEDEIRNRKETLIDAVYGTRRFIIGLSKKVLISNGCSQFAEMVYGGDPAVYGTVCYWLAALAYMLQIYFDFSGYSDMAIGLGRIFGFHFLENFDHPYIATSITDFWRRWHISLSTWFRDYIYIPLGGSRCGRGRAMLNLMIVWALTGLWHGASWNFVLWGLYYGVLLMLEKLVIGKILDRLPKIFGWVYTMFIVLIGWVLFDLTDAAQLSQALEWMFSSHPETLLAIITEDTSIIQYAVYLPVGLVFMFPVGRGLQLLADRSEAGKAVFEILADLVCILLLVLCVIYLLSSQYNPFIYFRF